MPAVGAVTVLAGYGRAGVARASAPGPTGQFELYSWWTDGPEQHGLLALLADFRGRAPQLSCYNGARIGRATADPKAELGRRLAAGDPPDSFQWHAGAELADLAAAGRLTALDGLYRQEGWAATFPAALLPGLRGPGGYYGVPVGIHRANLIWSNPAVLARAGADPAPPTVGALVDNLHRVACTGVVPLALGGSWSAKHLLETVLLAAVGPDGWPGLWSELGQDTVPAPGTAVTGTAQHRTGGPERGPVDGDGPDGGWSSERVTGALNDFRELLALSSHADPALPGWEDATALVGTARAGYQVTGDWAEGHLRGTLGLRPGLGYDWAPAPGTDGVFQYLSDVFVLAAGARHPAAALAWLAECGSPDGQLAFNGAKGAIPARTDLPAQARTLFGPYARWSLEQWRDARIVGSLTHGVVASTAWNARIDAALAVFLGDRDVARFQDALAAAAATSRPGGAASA
ncbi:ABC transporter substrate-binding protein [Kitasatospora sp. NPDC088346]|uniref:ABC transporter substrate-binding protein n=1 Tax=Kitasatospora sp. NPDC088346 TaxID=3364073 RepID=UPI003813A548